MSDITKGITMNQLTTRTTIIQRVMFTIMLASPAISQSQTAIIDAGNLAGFDDIIFAGMSYDVRFRDGSYLTIFGDSSGLDFDTVAAATDATTALLEAITEYPLYDTTPNLTIGCTFTADSCQMLTPYDIDGLTVKVRNAQNQPTGPNTVPPPGTVPAFTSTTSNGGVVYADWSQPTVIPLPAVIWLMGTGLLGLFGYSRRKVQ